MNWPEAITTCVFFMSVAYTIIHFNINLKFKDDDE